MMRTGIQKIEENIRFLKSVPLMQTLSWDLLAKIADVLEVVKWTIQSHLLDLFFFFCIIVASKLI